jgi:membrane protein
MEAQRARHAALSPGRKRGGRENERSQADQKPQTSGGEVEHDAGEAKGLGVRAFQKFNNDWTMNLVSMVAYNLMTAFFPLVLAVFTILALIPVASGNTGHFAAQINSILPGNVSSNIKVNSLLSNVNKSRGVLELASIVGLLWGGTNLFGAIESAFAVIFRVKTRGFIRQKLMSVAMILLFVVLLPISFASSVLLSSATTTLGKILPGILGGPVGVVIGFAASLAVLFVLFLSIFLVVPNLPIGWRQAWRGALVAAVVMWIVNALFPFYAAHFVGTKQYGAAAIGGAILTITWFWFFSVVLLVGAQVNALVMDIGPWPYDLSGMLMRCKIPAKEGEPTAMDAVKETEDKQEQHSPFGIGRDSQQVEAAKSEHSNGHATTHT